MLLGTRQMTVLQHSLEVSDGGTGNVLKLFQILGRLSDWSANCRENLCESNTIDVCLQLIPDGDILTQKYVSSTFPIYFVRL